MVPMIVAMPTRTVLAVLHANAKMWDALNAQRTRGAERG
jgi:hypothetical protein